MPTDTRGGQMKVAGSSVASELPRNCTTIPTMDELSPEEIWGFSNGSRRRIRVLQPWRCRRG
jgi:hypothetical protein